MRRSDSLTIQFEVPIAVHELIKKKADKLEMTTAAYSRMITLLSTQCDLDLKLKEFSYSNDSPTKVIQFQVSKENQKLIADKADKSLLKAPIYSKLVTIMFNVGIAEAK